jgi:hypothetical protein
MGLFTRRAKMPEFVLRAGTWRPFPRLLLDEWEEIAGGAWEGYQIGGRGFVMLDTERDGVAYIPVAAPAVMASRDRVTKAVRRDCSRYKPEREFVLVAYGARNAKAANEGRLEPFYGVVAVPKGVPKPPEAFTAREILRARMKAEQVASFRAQLDEANDEWVRTKAFREQWERAWRPDDV